MFLYHLILTFVTIQTIYGLGKITSLAIVAGIKILVQGLPAIITRQVDRQVLLIVPAIRFSEKVTIVSDTQIEDVVD